MAGGTSKKKFWWVKRTQGEESQQNQNGGGRVGNQITKKRIDCKGKKLSKENLEGCGQKNLMTANWGQARGVGRRLRDKSKTLPRIRKKAVQGTTRGDSYFKKNCKGDKNRATPEHTEKSKSGKKRP